MGNIVSLQQTIKSMSAPYDFFRTPQRKDEDKVKYHARLVVKNTMTTEEVVELIASRCSLQPGDVTAALIELAKVFKDEMAEGRNVQLKGIGSFRIKAKSPAVSSPKEIRAENISFGGVVYTPEAKLLRSLSGTRFERAKEIHRSLELSDGEIDRKLTEHFAEHDSITTREMCSLCGLRKATALRRLKERVDEGKLRHPGYLRAPFYYPVAGCFGKE